MLEITENISDRSAVLRIAGRVNGVNALELGARLDRLVTRGCRAIVVDLSGLEHMTSAGFRSLLVAERHAGEAGGALVLCGLHGLTLELFEIGGFLEMFTVAASHDEAIRLATGA